MKTIWFKKNKIGCGVSPVSREGWGVSIVFIGMLILSAYINSIFAAQVSIKGQLQFGFEALLIIALFVSFVKGRVDYNNVENTTCVTNFNKEASSDKQESKPMMHHNAHSKRNWYYEDRDYKNINI